MLNINSLIMEVTRRCNMKCNHCLRGDAQSKTMKNVYMEGLLRNVSYISSVTFTGGEPTLPSGMKVIEEFMYICNHLGIEVGNFYMVTNAKVWRPELPELINRLYDFCTENEISSIDISGDRFHETNGFEVNDFRNRLSEVLEYQYGLDDIVSIRPDIDYKHVINEGRGSWSHRENEPETFLLSKYDGELTINEGVIYLNCDGQVIAGCDWSYESQKTREDIFLCNYDGDLEQAILDYYKIYFHPLSETEDELIEEEMVC